MSAEGNSASTLHLPEDNLRFVIELELVQCLANPEYLHWLALSRYLEDAAFISFLRYLKYWKTPDYARYILYPHALAILDLLQKESFRKEIAKQPFKRFLQSQQLLHWRYYLQNRRRHRPDKGQQVEVASDSRAQQLQDIHNEGFSETTDLNKTLAERKYHDRNLS